jgi:S-adenosylmethionine hydrolase
MNRIVTLTTDFGLKDPYAGAMKGAMLSAVPAITIVDITHLVSPGNILEGAFILNEACRYFPRGTVHVGVVDPGVGGKRKPILLETQDYFFVGPDNGLLSLAARSLGMIRAIELIDERFFLPEVSGTFHGRDIFGPVAASLASGVSVERFGRELGRIEALDIPGTATADGVIEGEVIYVDSFGNLITNITKEEIASFAGTPEVLINGVAIDGVKNTYEAAKKGGLLALIGSSGHLEVAVNTGSAEGALKSGVGEKVKVRPKR